MSSPYDDGYYRPHAERYGYRYLADFLHDVFRPGSVVDFGCGIGETLRHLRDRGCEICGLDGSDAASRASRIDVTVADLSGPVDLRRKFDLAISVEVAEHLAEVSADQFVANIAAHGDRAVFFTAARPGQGGVGHVNCRPKSYWVEKFVTHGFARSRLLEWCAQAALYPLIWDAWWIRSNAVVLVKGRGPVLRGLVLLPRYLVAALLWRVRSSRWGQMVTARAAPSPGPPGR